MNPADEEPARGLLGRSSLQRRVGVAFALVSLVVTGLFALVTWNLAADYLTDQRQESATRLADVNARLVERSLAQRPSTGLDDLLTGLAGEPGTTVALRGTQGWTTSGRDVDLSVLPDPLLTMADNGDGARQRLLIEGVPSLAVTLPLSGGSVFVEIFPLTELDRTLRFLGVILAVGVAGSTLLGLALGAWAGRRALQPVTQLTHAAERVAAGDLAARLPSSAGAGLGPLVATFNRTAAALEERVARDVRFAADVSHELRSPLTTLVNAVAVLRRRRDGLSDASRQAVDLLDAETQRFRDMVLDLLEISRGEELERERFDLGSLVRDVVDGSERRAAPDVEVTGDVVVSGDRRRLERVIGNLLDNADVHAGGAVRIAVYARGDRARVEVDDAGPGIPPGQRQAVFERFARGELTDRRTDSCGTGLGLALVADHVARHGGAAWIEDRPGGGTRLIVDLPRETG